MQIAELEARNDAAWRAYCRIRDAADHSMMGSAALAEFGRVHALITDPEHPELFEAWAKEAAAADKEAPAVTASTAPDDADEEAEDEEDDARTASHKPKGKR